MALPWINRGWIMELRTTSGQLDLGGAFRLVATGYFFGAGAIFIPLFALITVVMVAAGVPGTFNDTVVEGGGSRFVAVLPLIMMPVILAIQAVMFGGLAVLGLWLYTRWKQIRVIER
jgi:Flp pilus assembly pilin Flp